MKSIPDNIKEIVQIDERSPTGLSWVSCGRSDVEEGTPCGSLNLRGYYQTNILGDIFLNHRIVFFLHNGYLPEIVDHIDRNTINNSPDNLREADKSQNQANQKIRIDNTHGVKGVYFNKKREKPWWCSVTFRGKTYFGGSFKTLEEAADAVSRLRKNVHGDFASSGKETGSSEA